MPAGLKVGDKLATFNIPLEKWERFKETVGKGNAAKTLNAMISAYLDGAIDVSNWVSKPIDGAAEEWTRELESRLDWKIKTAIADLDAKYTARFANCEKTLDTVLIAVNAIEKDVMPQIVDLEGATTYLKTSTKLQSELIETIQKDLARNKWMIEKYADVLMEVEKLQIAVATLQEETAAYMKGV